MKTVSEKQRELAEGTAKVEVRLVRRANLWRAYLQSVVADDIAPYQPTARNDAGNLIDRTDYSELREANRIHINALELVWYGFISTACNDCKTILFNASPSMTLMSNPPKFWADCIGCGRRYALQLSFREYADPPTESGNTDV